MKNTTRSSIYLAMAAMTLTAALAIPAAAQNQVPFKGTFQGSDTVIPGTIVTNATGTGTLVGKFSLFDVFTPTPSPGTGTGHWIAANRDSIDTTFFVASIEFGPVVVTITETHTITAGTGTGRFTGFTVHRTHVRAPSDDGTHITYGWFEGTITPPGAVH